MFWEPESFPQHTHDLRALAAPVVLKQQFQWSIACMYIIIPTVKTVTIPLSAIIHFNMGASYLAYKLIKLLVLPALKQVTMNTTIIGLYQC